MKIGVGVLTFNHIKHGRQQDFQRTWDSIQDAGHPAEFLLLTNGSTDGTSEVVRGQGGIVDDTRSEIWYGNQRLVDELIGRGNDLIILSADDLEYKPGWLADLVSFIEAAPPFISLLSCYLEPIWQWNQPRQTVQHGGQRAVIRDSVCGSSWAFRASDWLGWMGPFPRIFPGEDLKVCDRVRDRGNLMAALDLVEHIGQERSAWGNQSHTYAQPFDRQAWGLNGRVEKQAAADLG